MNAEPEKTDMPGIPGLGNMLEDFMADYGQRREQIAEVQAKIKKTRTTASADKRMMTVTVGPQGELKSLKFNNEDYRDLASSDLANMIVKTVNKAREAAMEKMGALLAPTLPPTMDFESIMNGKADLASLLPENPFETLDLARFLERHKKRDDEETR
jgi:DNA-binding protein YbaB